MNQDLAKEVLGILQSTKEFVLAQAPDVVKQLITYQTWKLGINIVLFGILFAVGAVLLKRAMTLLRTDEYDSFGEMMGCFIIGGFAGLIGMCESVRSLDKFILVSFAPKIFLIEYLSKLVK